MLGVVARNMGRRNLWENKDDVGNLWEKPLCIVVIRNIPTGNIPTGKLPTKKNAETLTSTPQEPPGLELRIPTRAKRTISRHNVAT